MTHPQLGDHLTRFLGAATQVRQLDRGVQLWRHERPEYVSFATRGLSDLDVAALKPQELVCSVLSGQDGAAAHLVTAMFEQILETDRGPLVPQLIPSQAPILDRTNIHGLLAASHPYLDDAFNTVTDNGDIRIQIVTLIPLTAAEVQQAQTGGLDALIDTLEVKDPPLLDVTR
ncbi:Suppressor of fused protein (SUFU) [Amycolatopsis tolypomycina]|uniref:Suppressor of fused protein (SUFU) n=1 Tax=Amycolatopsis tolypomycina TaxID=208445 RepID=A0A1H4JLS9_9PSEU|nr:suppressor of fused domain protein [Amycolatopsis tolypomycina]SEB47284.1 Suppressor of fused protein (SUFU) [Amycolatopsis tolypomycina]